MKKKRNLLLLTGVIVATQSCDQTEVVNIPDGTAGNPYLIESAADLKTLADLVNSGEDQHNTYYRMTRDIDLECTQDHQWIPIGGEFHSFKGFFDGGGHEVSGIYIDTTDDFQGLFGAVSTRGQAMIQNVGVSGYIKGGTYVGGVVGYIFSSDSTTSSIQITNCYNTGSVKGQDHTGGVLGYIGSSSETKVYVTNCYNTGEVKGEDDFTGGIIGLATSTTTIEVAHCYNTGTVNAMGDFAGGISGFASSSSSVHIAHCYSTGIISCMDYVGGIAGFSSASLTIKNCYTKEYSTIGQVKGDDGALKTGEEMRSAAFVDLLNGSASSQQWMPDVTPEINGGYPILSYQASQS